MPSAALRLQIERSLERRFPAALTPAPRAIHDVAGTGITEVDAYLEGGFPVGAISELTGPESSGRTSLALAFAARRTAGGRACAWVDVADAFDPESAAANGLDLRRLLWVRCRDGAAPAHVGGPVKARAGKAETIRKAEIWTRLKTCTRLETWTRLDQALRATDLLLQAGGFAAIVLDLGDTAREQANRIPLATWFRFRQAADRTRCSLAVLEGRAPEEAVCALNRHARVRGAALGMTRLEVESLQGLTLLARSTEGEAAARAVFLECAAQFSPRVEEASRGTACAFVLDIQGAERLLGPPRQLAARLRASLAAAGFRASIGVSANYDAARMKAAAARGIMVIPQDAEASALEKLPIAALELAEAHEEIFALWGMRMLGELAGLPEAELVTRLGAEARAWRQLARGEAAHAFQPIEAALSLEEFCEFETPVEQMDSLLFIGARMIDCLVARAATRALSLAVITVDMKLEARSVHCRMHRRVLRPAVPSTDRKFLLKLLQLEIGAHPPQAAVTALTLTAEAGQSGKVQMGLFAPQMPEPSRLDVTLARLKAMVGDDRVGSPVLEDTHRAGSFRMEGFATDGAISAQVRAVPGPKIGTWGTRRSGSARQEAE